MSAGSRKVLVQYFAMLREEAGLSEEEIWTSAETAEDLYEELRERHGFALDRSGLKLVVNEEFCEWSRAVADGDTIVFIPPVAGGRTVSQCSS